MTNKTKDKLVKEVWDHYTSKSNQDQIHWPNHTKEELEQVMHHEMNAYEVEEVFHHERTEQMACFLIELLENNRLTIADMESFVANPNEYVLKEMIETLIQRKDYKSSELAVDLQRFINTTRKKLDAQVVPVDPNTAPANIRALLKREVA